MSYGSSEESGETFELFHISLKNVELCRAMTIVGLAFLTDTSIILLAGAADVPDAGGFVLGVIPSLPLLVTLTVVGCIQASKSLRR